MKKKNINEIGHNYPFDPDKSPFSKFEEKVFPKILFIGVLTSVVVLFIILLIYYNFGTALIFTLVYSLLWIFLLGPVIVKLMIYRREKIIGYE